MTTGRLFVRNLPFSAKEEELEAYFSRYGDVSQVSVCWRCCIRRDEYQYRDSGSRDKLLRCREQAGIIASNNK